MATTSVWAVKESPKTKHSAVKDRIDYVMNEEKTVEVLNSDDKKSIENFIDAAMLIAPEDVKKEHNEVENIIEYATQSVKTETDIRRYVSGINCIPETAFEEFEATKKRFGKTDGRLAYHGYQSFPPGEVTPDKAHELGIKLAEEMWPGFEVVVATHLDREHIHNHFVVNSVCMEDGHKFHNGKDDYRRMREISDRLCLENGLSIVENPGHAIKRKRGEKYTTDDFIRADFDAAIMNPEVKSFSDFLNEITGMGYTVKTTDRKYFTVIPPGKEKPVRVDRENHLGSEYGIERITERIKEKEACDHKVILSSERKIKRTKKPEYVFRLNLRRSYNVYSTILIRCRQVVPSQYKMSWQVRNDLNWIAQINGERAYLRAAGLKTIEEVNKRHETQTGVLNELTERKRQLINKYRRNGDDADLKKEISQTRQRIRLVNEELKMLSGIQTRSKNLNEKINGNYKRTGYNDKEREERKWQKQQM